MRKKINQLILLTFCCITSNLFGQQRDVSGMVTETGGEALVGVNVRVKGTTVGTITDIDGKYSVKAADGQTLTFSYLGYSVKETVLRAGQTVVNVVDNLE